MRVPLQRLCLSSLCLLLQRKGRGKGQGAIKASMEDDGKVISGFSLVSSSSLLLLMVVVDCVVNCVVVCCGVYMQQVQLCKNRVQKMTSSNTSVGIKKLGKDNYQPWQFRMSNYLMGVKVFGDM